MRDQIYEQEIQKHINKMQRILNEYSKNLNHLKETDELAIQRAFQILIESIIGVARYYLQTKYSVNVNRSREAFDELKNRNELDQNTHEQIMKIIGFRNVLVHDDLEIDFGIIRSLLLKKSYEVLIKFSEELQKKL